MAFNGKDVVVGIGSALVDILIHTDDAFLNKTGAAKGGMTLVDKEFIEKTLAMAANRSVLVPGGSACNTVIGVGKLGGRARFLKSSTPTGRVLSLITPDAQRSMFTFLGAASEAHPEELLTCEFNDAAVVHVEGYLLFNKALIQTALARAKAAGAMVSLDLASYTIVKSSKEFLEELIEKYVDILIANEDEAEAFTGFSDEEKAIEALSKRAPIAVLKVGKRGSYIAEGARIYRIGPLGNGDAMDTTGAGDLWAAGFLFGLVQGFPIEKCGAIGSACGYEVCQVMGASIPDEGWKRIKSSMEE
ncbi:MAG: adenosine kinase [Deltaproteobacteria bacterium]